RLAAQLLREIGLGAAHADQLRVLIQRDADAAGLLGEGFEDRLAHPPHRIRDELHALVRIELLHCLEQPLIADGDELREIEAVSLVLLDVGNDESEVGGHEPLGGFFITTLDAPGQPTLFRGIFYQWELLDVLEVLVECTGRISPKKRLRFACLRARHSCRAPTVDDRSLIRESRDRGNIEACAKWCKSARFSTSQ